LPVQAPEGRDTIVAIRVDEGAVVDALHAVSRTTEYLVHVDLQFASCSLLAPAVTNSTDENPNELRYVLNQIFLNLQHHNCIYLLLSP
jgi:hypothetical protein